MARTLLLGFLSCASCHVLSDCPPDLDWEALDARAAAGALAESCQSSAPPELLAWLRSAAAGGASAPLTSERTPLWSEACPAVTPSEVDGTPVAMQRIAQRCPLPEGFVLGTEGSGLSQVTGDPALALVVHSWLADGDPQQAARVARALRGGLPYPAPAPLHLPEAAGPRFAEGAHTVVSPGGLHLADALFIERTSPGVPLSLPLEGGPGGQAVAAWSEAGPVVAADIEAPAADLVRLLASRPDATLRLLATRPEGGLTTVTLTGSDAPAEGRLWVGPEGVDGWRGDIHLAPVPGCPPNGLTVCAEHPDGLAGVVSHELRIAVGDGLSVGGLVWAVHAYQGAGIAALIDLSVSPCVPAPEGMSCLAAGALQVGMDNVPKSPPRTVALPTFYVDAAPVSASDYRRCVDAQFCPKGDAYSWESASRYCAWAGKRLPTEWEWEKAAQLGAIPPVSQEWTRSWLEPSSGACGAACTGPAPLGPCGGSEPCHLSAQRVVRGGAGGVSSRVGSSTGARRDTAFRCALSGGEGADPPPFLGRGSPSLSPQLTAAPARLAIETRPDPGPLSQPSAEALALARGIDTDTIEDKPVCGEDVVKSWEFPSGKGGKSEMDCRDPITYVTTNEKRIDLFGPYIDNLGGAYAGVGADQNYDFIARAHSRWAWVFDYDPNVVRLHKVLFALVGASETPEAFLARFAPASTADSMDLIAAAYADDPQLGFYQRFFLGYQARLAEVYRRGMEPRPESPGFGWLRHPDQYAYIREMMAQGRIVALPGDMLSTHTMQSVGRAARALGEPIRVFYTSNAPTSWGGQVTPEWRANVAALPFDDDSVVLVTWNHGSFGGTDYWHYNVQRALTYQQRLQHSGYDYMWQLAWDRIPSQEPDLTLTNLAGR